MKALDHYSRGERLERQQATLDPATFSDGIIGACHGAAYHFVCAGLNWAGARHVHDYSKHSSMLKEAAVPLELQAAWDALDQLLTSVFCSSEPDEPGEAAATAARTHLATIKGWAQGLRPESA